MKILTPYSYNKPSTPLLLSSSVVLTPGTASVPPMEELTSPFREPHIVDEIRFSIVRPSAASPGGDYSSIVTCRFRMGRVEFSPKDIPIWLYGTSMQQNTFEQNITSSTLNLVHTERRWKLPVPLFVPAGMSLLPYFQSPAGSAAGVRVKVAYAGRYVDSSEPVPKRIQVPYVTAFYPNLAGILTGASYSTFYKSGEQDLANVLDTPVRVQRFIGRIAGAALGGGGAGSEVTDNGGTSGNNSFLVTMKDSYAREVVRSPGVSFSSVFDENRRGYTFSKVLGPRERYLMTITGAGSDDPATLAQFPMVSMIGFREEVFS